MILDGKVCVITGAAGGIGAASIERFAAEGARVIGIDLMPDTGAEVSLQADLTDEQQVIEVLTLARAAFGRIDVLFNNAGIAPPDDSSVLETSLEAFRRVQEVNLTSVFLCCKHGIPHLLANEGPRRGSVVNTASFVAHMGAAISQVSYTASKGGVLALSRELGVEFARQGIRVNALCPGPVDTPLLRGIFAQAPEQLERRLVHLPMGRFAEAREIADAALFLASDLSSYMTGASLMADGGITAAYVTAE